MNALNRTVYLLLVLLIYGLITSFSIPTLLLPIEICDNGIDDDGDGLIDLQDNDCNCNHITPLSFIPNPSFENYTTCPTNFSQLNQAASWQQASAATTDYYNCGIQSLLPNSAGYPIAPIPYPDGTGYVGFHSGEQSLNYFKWNEYAGACLTDTLDTTTTYTIQFYLGFGSISQTSNTGIIYPSISPFTVAIYGHSSCTALPFVGTTCPPAIDGWEELGEITLSGNNEWVRGVISFTPSQPINAIAIGSNCDSLAYLFYHFLDDLHLSESTTLISYLYGEGACMDTITLFAPSSPLSGVSSVQWYKNGIAISGATQFSYQLPPLGAQEGYYQVRFDNGTTCVVTDSFYAQNSILKILRDDTLYFCNEDQDIPIASNILSLVGTYNWTPPNGLSCIDCSNPVITNPAETTYILEYTDTSGCIINEQIDLRPQQVNVSFNPAAPSYCTSDPPIQLSAILNIDGGDEINLAEPGCIYELRLYDSGADGWENALLFTISSSSFNFFQSQYASNSPIVSELFVARGDSIRFFYTSGLDDSEISWELYDETGTLVIQEGPFPTTGNSHTVYCRDTNILPSCMLEISMFDRDPTSDWDDASIDVQIDSSPAYTGISSQGSFSRKYIRIPNGSRYDIYYNSGNSDIDNFYSLIYIPFQLGSYFMDGGAGMQTGLVFTGVCNAPPSVQWIPADGLSDPFNTTTMAAPDSTEIYQFVVTQAGGICADTFSLALICTILEQACQSFRSSTVGDDVLLNWEMSNLPELSHFLLEQSNDGIHFTPLSEIPIMSGQTNYAYTDAMALHSNQPSRYYRLTLAHPDGSYSHVCKIINVQTLTDSAIRIYPNPSADKMVLEIELPRSGHFPLRIIDPLGRVLFAHNYFINSGWQRIEINLEGLPVGDYILAFEIDGQFWYEKIIKTSH